MTREQVERTIELIMANDEYTPELKNELIAKIKETFPNAFKDKKTLTRERKLRSNLNWLIGGIENSIADGYMEPMTEEELIDYCIPAIYNINARAGECYCEEGINEDIKFLGNKKIHKMILSMGSECIR